MWRKVALLACLTLRVFAQGTISNATSGSWTALNGTWRWHAGDNPQWAAPSFDDSKWLPLHIPGPLPPDRHYWIRLPVQTGRMSDPGLLLGPIAYAYDVYWDGQRIGNFGDLTRNQWFVPRWQTFHVPRELRAPVIMPSQFESGKSVLISARAVLISIPATAESETSPPCGMWNPRI